MVLIIHILKYSKTPFLTLQEAHIPRFLSSPVSEHQMAAQEEQNNPIIYKNSTVKTSKINQQTLFHLTRNIFKEELGEKMPIKGLPHSWHSEKFGV